MTTGARAQVYADHFIKVHLGEIGKAQTYSQLSGKLMADPKNAALAGADGLICAQARQTLR